MGLSFIDYNKFRNLYLAAISARNSENEHRILNHIINLEFKEYTKKIEEETRVKNLLRLFFSKKIWDEFERLELIPQEFYDKFLLLAKELDEEKNRLNFESKVRYNSDEKEEVELIERRLYKVTLNVLKKLTPIYQNYFIKEKKVFK